jgi:SAM-dependent methyltransferase
MTEDTFFDCYDETFWKENGSREHRESERKIGRVIAELTGVKGPVVDVGCGTGQMLRAIDEMGARPVLGLESAQGLEWCRKLGIQDLERDETRAVDLRDPLPSYDFGEFPHLVVCVEVLEHLPEEAAKRLVGEICRWSPTWIALSGAAPGSPGGTGHINEQQPLYWMNLLHSFGTHWFDPIASDELHRRTWGTFTWSHLVNLYRRME